MGTAWNLSRQFNFATGTSRNLAPQFPVIFYGLAAGFSVPGCGSRCVLFLRQNRFPLHVVIFIFEQIFAPHIPPPFAAGGEGVPGFPAFSY